MDRLDEILSGHVEEEDYSHSVRKAAAIGKRLLNKYYSLTDVSDVYRISMSANLPKRECFMADLFPVLHPHYKTEYFRDNDWAPSWISDAEKLLRDELERSYKSPNAQPPGPNTAEKKVC